MITLLLLVCATYGVVLGAHSVMVNRAFSTTPAKSFQQHPLLFITNHTDHTFYL